MKHQLKSAARIAAWISTGLLIAFVWLTPNVAGASAPPDAWITMKAKLALLTTENVHATAVNVDTVKGQVTLHGKVESAAEKTLAETTAKNVEGVQSVRNLLQVVPPKQEKAVQQSDDEIKKRVDQALRADKSLEGSSITVQSVNNGVVLLAGTAKTLPAHLSAVEVAYMEPGVRRVASEITSPETAADQQIWHESTSKVAKAAHGAGDVARDAYITAATKMHLLADRDTPALEINVDTRNSVVTLFGIVPTSAAKTAAESDARKVSGVKQIKNELQVVPKARQEIVKATDDTIKHDIKQAFENRQDFEHVDVDVKNCVARLTGTVATGPKRLEAAVVARSTQGVCSVQDDLRITDDQLSAR